MRMSDKVRISVVGIGGLARSVHLPALAELASADIVAVCDIVEAKAAQAAAKYGVPKVYTVYLEMLERERLDAVFCLVQPENHFRVVLDCLTAGVDVFMEKPPGITAFQAESLQRAARE